LFIKILGEEKELLEKAFMSATYVLFVRCGLQNQN